LSFPDLEVLTVKDQKVSNVAHEWLVLSCGLCLRSCFVSAMLLVSFVSCLLGLTVYAVYVRVVCVVVFGRLCLLSSALCWRCVPAVRVVFVSLCRISCALYAVYVQYSREFISSGEVSGRRR